MNNENVYDYINSYFTNPYPFIILLIVVILYITLFLSLGSSSTNASNSTSSSGSEKTIYIIILSIFVILVLIFWFQNFGDYNISTNLTNALTNNPKLDIVMKSKEETKIPKIKFLEEVFNIPGNYYGYEDAKSICQAYGARLAKYDEVESAYNNGGEWCNYGWSDKQMALFPTQKATFDNLQKIKGHEHDCGRPGVNGGYIANPNVKFGVNCFGYKPKMTAEEEEYMQTISPYPKTEKDIRLEEKVNYWKNKIDSILVSPFNYTSWSRI
jgi:hypothetical protein